MKDTAGKTTQDDLNSWQKRAGCSNRYQIKRILGQGGMGVVFQALDQELSRDVAIKILLCESHRDPAMQERFLREAQAVSGLNHPNIIRIFSSGLNADGNPYHVMEFLEGKTLAEELAAGRLSARRFFELVPHIVDGLVHAHKQKLVHRDLKPSNIMICKDLEGNEQVKIIDFGIVRFETTGEQSGRTLTNPDAILGSPTYMSPEQCRGERITFSSDIYSLGCVMYECITGTPPFEGDSVLETMYKHMTEPAPSLASNAKSPESRRLAQLVDRCLEKSPVNRPTSMSELGEQFAELARSEIEKLDLFANRVRTLTGVGLVCAAISFAVIALLVVHQWNARPRSNEEPLALKSEQTVNQAQIKKLKRELAAPEAVLFTRSKWAVSLDKLFELGHLQLKSEDPKDQLDSRQTFSQALKHCCDKEQFVEYRPWGYALRARAEWMKGDTSAAESDIDEAIDLARHDPCLQTDMWLEKALLEVHTGNYERALNLCRKVKDDCVANHKADAWMMKPCDWQSDRGEMMARLVGEMQKHPPKSVPEAKQMSELSSLLASIMVDFSFRRKEAKMAAEFSNQLMQKFGNDPARKDVCNSIIARCGG